MVIGSKQTACEDDESVLGMRKREKTAPESTNAINCHQLPFVLSSLFWLHLNSSPYVVRHSNPARTNHCRHRWVDPPPLAQLPGILPQPDTVWRRVPYHHNCSNPRTHLCSVALGRGPSFSAVRQNGVDGDGPVDSLTFWHWFRRVLYCIDRWGSRVLQCPSGEDQH